jgi:hypothetical protein
MKVIIHPLCWAALALFSCAERTLGGVDNSSDTRSLTEIADDFWRVNNDCGDSYHPQPQYTELTLKAIEMLEDSCADKSIDFYACVGLLDCSTFQIYYQNAGPNPGASFPCRDEYIAYNESTEACFHSQGE